MRLLPLTLLVAVVLGFVVVGQTVALLTRAGAREWVGVLMVTVIIRELGPIVAATLVLARSGTANVIELGGVCGRGELASLRKHGIDPVRHLVVPRVVGSAISTAGLSVYLVGGALVGAYAFAFVQNVPLTLEDYVGQLLGSLRWLDFTVPTLKALGFGAVIALVTSYHGLARPRPAADLPSMTVRALIQSVGACVLLDALAMLPYLL